jgi:predicted nucleic acid-binding protein
MTAIDTNVMIYAYDDDEPVKRRKALALLTDLTNQSEHVVLLWQVAEEFLNCLRKWESKNKMSSTDVENHFHDVLDLFSLRHPSEAYFDISFDLRRRHSLSHWDSLLLAACREAGNTTIYSEDLQNGANYDGVTVVNPFA